MDLPFSHVLLVEVDLHSRRGVGHALAILLVERELCLLLIRMAGQTHPHDPLLCSSAHRARRCRGRKILVEKWVNVNQALNDGRLRVWGVRYGCVGECIGRGGRGV